MIPLRPSATTLACTALAVGMALTGCTEAIPEPTATTSPTSTAAALSTADPRGREVDRQLAALRTTVTAADERLQAARDAPDTAAAHAAATAAVGLLTAAPDLLAGRGVGASASPSPAPASPADAAASPASAGPSSPAAGSTPGAGPGSAVAPLFPGRESSREKTIDYGDVFTTLLTAARSTSTGGDTVVAMLRESVAGDLGTWQRSPGEMLDAIDRASRASDPATAILDLPGEGTRALAWTLLAARAGSITTVRDAAAHGIAHLQVILDATNDLTEAR